MDLSGCSCGYVIFYERRYVMGGRRKRSLINTAAALLSEVFVILVGMFFPRVLISCYGSATNGLISSLQQFAQYFTLISTGLMGAVVFALYSPLAERDKAETERLVASAGKVFSRMGIWYTVVLVLFGLVYPILAADTPYSYFQVVVMFIAIGINGASQLFYSGKFKALLSASQHNGTAAAINAVFTVAFSLIMIFCALSGVNAVVAVILSSLAYIVRAAAYGIAARRYFPDHDFRLRGEAHSFNMQREVMIQQILTLIVMNVSMIAMTVLGTDMTEISVFSVYNMVLTAVFVVSGAVNTGVSAGFGDLITRGDGERLRAVYREYEMIFQIFWTVMAGCTAVMFRPFITLYASDVTDAVYVRPVLCLLFGILGALWMIRVHLSTIVVAAGKYKEIQRDSIIEAVLAVVLSGTGLIFFGLEGMILGRIIVTAFRVVSFSYCNCKYVIKGELGYTWVQIGASSAVIVFVYVIFEVILGSWTPASFIEWGAVAVVCCFVLGILAVGAELLINRKMFLGAIRRSKR